MPFLPLFFMVSPYQTLQFLICWPFFFFKFISLPYWEVSSWKIETVSFLVPFCIWHLVKCLAHSRNPGKYLVNYQFSQKPPACHFTDEKTGSAGSLRQGPSGSAIMVSSASVQAWLQHPSFQSTCPGLSPSFGNEYCCRINPLFKGFFDSLLPNTLPLNRPASTMWPHHFLVSGTPPAYSLLLPDA